jgi:carboxylesterase type B
LFEPWTPTVGRGGGIVADQPLFLYQQGKANSVPIVNGVVSEDGRMFVFEALSTPVPPIEYEALIGIVVGRETGLKIMKQYPVPSGVKDARDIASIAVTDGIFHCPNWNATKSIPQDSAYFYEFDHVMSFYGNGSFGGFSPGCEGHVCHQEELVFVFYPTSEEILEKVGSTYTAAEKLLGQRMNNYWADFAKNGNPGSGDPTQPLNWPAMGSNGTMMEFRLKDSIRTSAYAEKCKFWDDLGYPWLK